MERCECLPLSWKLAWKRELENLIVLCGWHCTPISIKIGQHLLKFCQYFVVFLCPTDYSVLMSAYRELHWRECETLQSGLVSSAANSPINVVVEESRVSIMLWLKLPHKQTSIWGLTPKAKAQILALKPRVLTSCNVILQLLLWLKWSDALLMSTNWQTQVEIQRSNIKFSRCRERHHQVPSGASRCNPERYHSITQSSNYERWRIEFCCGGGHCSREGGDMAWENLT